MPVLDCSGRWALRDMRRSCEKPVTSSVAIALPDSFREMEPLFLAVVCGCNADLYREALHEVYIPRIQRGNVFFAANVLGARGPLLWALAHFFEDRLWESPLEMGLEGQSLTAEDQLFILRRLYIYRSREECNHRRYELATSARSPCVIRLIVPFSFMWL
jgi:hypothetical protein